MFFSSWDAIERTLIVGFCAYIGLVLLLRISGKRTLSKMNAFDMVVTVALGSTLATILLSKDVSLAQGLTAFFMLIALQYVITFMSSRSRLVSNLVKSEPVLLYYNGRFLNGPMKKERVPEVEMLQAARSSGIASLEEVEAVILETDGSLSVTKKTSKPHSTLDNVVGKPEKTGSSNP